MSRHRNVRHLVAEDCNDYYDDYEDDYYDDDYDDYENGYSANNKNTTKQTQPQRNVNNTTKASTPTPKKQPNKQLQQKQQQPKTKATTTTRTPTTTTTIATTPIRTTTTTAKSYLTQSPTRGGVMAPPPGFSAAPPPGLATTPTRTTTTTTSSSSSIKPKLPITPSSTIISSPSVRISVGSLSSSSSPSSRQQQQQQMPLLSSSLSPPPPIAKLEQEQDDYPSSSSLASSKPTVTCVVLGHVDAGKSTLTGHLLWAASQHVNDDPSSRTNTTTTTTTMRRRNQQQQHNNNKPTNFAWLLDEDEMERQHGITMDIATKTIEGQCHAWVLHDAPGHAEYVPNMITGTALADVCIAVVDVTDDIESKPSRQLQEHLILAKGLGITHILVAVNKMDLIQWKQDIYEKQVQALSQFIIQTIGFTKSKVQFLPLSGLQGINVYDNNNNINNPEEDKDQHYWYQKSPTLWQAMEQWDLFPHHHTTTTTATTTTGNKNKNNSGKATTTTTNKKQKITNRLVRLKLLEKPLRILVTDILHETRGGGVAIRAKVVSGWFCPPSLDHHNSSSSAAAAASSSPHVPPKEEARLLVCPVGESVRILQWKHVQEEMLSSTTGGSSVAAAGTAATTTTTTRMLQSRHKNSIVLAGEWVDFILTGLDVTRWSVGHVMVRIADTSLMRIMTKMALSSSLPPPPPLLGGHNQGGGAMATRLPSLNHSATGIPQQQQQKCRCRIYVLDTVTVPIIQGTMALLHIHALTGVPCSISQLIQATRPHQQQQYKPQSTMATVVSTEYNHPDGGGGGGGGMMVWKDRPRALTRQSQAIVEITILQRQQEQEQQQQGGGGGAKTTSTSSSSLPIVMEPFSDCRALGRFVLRRNGESIAVGRIEEVLPSLS